MNLRTLQLQLLFLILTVTLQFRAQANVLCSEIVKVRSSTSQLTPAPEQSPIERRSEKRSEIPSATRFENRNNYRVREVLSPEFADRLLQTLRAESDELSRKSSGSSSERSENLYQLYIKTRLEPLAQEHSVELQDLLLKRFKYGVHNRPDLSNETILNCSFSSSGISMMIPRPIAGTVVDFAIRVHEFEHAIQSKVTTWKERNVFHPKHFVEIFERETGAIVAESIVLLSVPRSELKDLLLQIKSEKLPDTDRKFIIGILEDALNASTPKDYLKLQWQRGRYSRGVFIKKQLDVYISLGLISGFGYWAYSVLFGNPF